MDKRFEGLVVQAIRQDRTVLYIEKQQERLYGRYSEGEEMSVSDVDIANILKRKHGERCAQVREAELLFWSEVNPYRLFRHKWYVTAEQQPELCVITKLVYCHHGALFQVHYRTSDGAGVRAKCEPRFFRRNVFGEWA